MHIIQLYLWDYVNVVLWCKFTRTSQRKMTWYNIHTHTHIHSCTSCWNGPGALHSEQSTVRACAYVSFLLARIHREAIKPRSQAKSQSMGSSLIDNSLEEDWKASFVKKIARATAEQNDIIVCYLRLLCHWANVLKPEMFGIRGERRSNTSSHGTLCCRDGSLRYAADLMDFMVCPVFAPAGCSPEHFANWNEAETSRSFGQDAYYNMFRNLFGGLLTHAQTPLAHRVSYQTRGWVEVRPNGRRFGCICQSKNTRSQIIYLFHLLSTTGCSETTWSWHLATWSI